MWFSIEFSHFAKNTPGVADDSAIIRWENHSEKSQQKKNQFQLEVMISFYLNPTHSIDNNEISGLIQVWHTCEQV